MKLIVSTKCQSSEHEGSEAAGNDGKPGLKLVRSFFLGLEAQKATWDCSNRSQARNLSQGCFWESSRQWGKARSRDPCRSPPPSCRWGFHVYERL